MANLKEIRTRIASVVSTRQITSAMKMVAASKLKKAQDAIINFRPYVNKMRELIVHASSAVGMDDESNVYAQKRDCRNVLIVTLTSNRGLCGAFNSNIIKETMQLASSKYGDLMSSGDVHFIAIGKKGYDNLRKKNLTIDDHNEKIFDQLTFENASVIAQSLMDSFLAERYDCIDIVYNEFINAATQKVVILPFLPLLPSPAEEENGHKERPADYIFEPTRECIIHELVPQNLKLIVYQALLDSVAAEFGARMTSMHQATDNATNLIQELTLQYNKARQAAITNELMEIVSGAEALKG